MVQRLGYWLDGRGVGAQFAAGAKILIFLTPRLALGPSQTPIKWVPAILSLVVNLPVHEADNSPPSIDEYKNGGDIPPLPYASMVWCLIKLRNKFTSYLPNTNLNSWANFGM
jgi:hypothetical protein